MTRGSVRVGIALLFLAILAVPLWSFFAPAAEAARVPVSDSNVPNKTKVEIGQVSLGIGGYYKLGRWTPIRVEITSDQLIEDGVLEVTVPDGDATPSRYSLPLSTMTPYSEEQGRGGEDASPQSNALVTRSVVKIGRHDGVVSLVVKDGEQILAEKQLPLQAASSAATDDGLFGEPLLDGQAHIVTLGDLATVERSLREFSQAKSIPLAISKVIDLGQLPEQPIGYEGIDVVVLNASQAIGQQLLEHPQQFSALDTWIKRGGRMLFAAGGDLAASQPEDNLWTRYVPGQVDGTVSLSSSLSFEEFCKTEDPLWSRLRGEGMTRTVPRIAEPQGLVVLRHEEEQESIPLVIRSPYGLGEVTFLAIDLDSDSFATWNGTGTLLARLLPSHIGGEVTGSAAPLATRAGYDDLTGRLRVALDNFEPDGIQPIPFWLIATIALIYLAMIAPGDYWLLRRLRGRMELTWITFPLLVIAVGAVCWWAANSSKGKDLRVNQIEVVDFDATDGRIYGTSWFTVFSPQTTTYDVGVEVSAPGAQADTKQGDADATYVSWQGLPGSGLGGMQSPASATVFEQPYEFVADDGTLAKVPMSIWSTKTFRASYTRTQAEPVVMDVHIDPGAAQSELVGTVVNQTEIPLEDCVLLYRDWIFKLGALPPGEKVALPEQWAADSLRYYLKQELQYDPESVDARTVLATMMFYDVAGGQAFAKLKSQFEPILDLSHQLNTGRVVLLGHAKNTISTPQVKPIGGKAPEVRGEALYRFVFDGPEGAKLNQTVDAPNGE